MITTAHTDGPRRVGLLSVHTSPLAQPGTGDGGGLNVVVAALARELRRRDIGVDVFTRAAGGDLPPTVLLDDGTAVHHVAAGPPGAAKEHLASHLCGFALGMVGHPAAAELDVLHAHYWMSGWVGRLVASRLDLPMVASFHTLARAKNARLAPGDRPEPTLRAVAEARVAAAADAIIANTPAEADVLRRAYGAAAGRMHVVTPGVDLTTFTPEGDRSADRAALGGGRIVLFVGRLQPLKAPDTAVRALAALDAHMPDDLPVRLVVVGGPSGASSNGSDPASLMRLARELGVDDRVAFLAPRSQHDLAALYRAADVVVVPSHSESFGLVALEAQACGTPVVAADVGGLSHALGRGAGTLVADRSPESYAAALAPYLLDPELARRAGQAGLARARGAGWDRVTEAMLAVYRTVMGCEPAAHADARGA